MSSSNNTTSGGSALYCLGVLGAWVHFWQQAEGFWAHLLAVVEGFLWPAFLVFHALSELA